MLDDAFDPGRLRSRVKLQRRPEGSPGPGPAGDESFAWADVGTYRAAVEPLAGRELWQAQQAKSTADYKVTLRIVGPLDPLRDRLIYRQTMVLSPESVTRLGGRSEYYEVLATYLRGEEP